MAEEQAKSSWFRSTTVVAVHRDGKAAMAADGQVSLGDTVVKGKARKVRTVAGGRVLAGFAGSSSDAFTLLDRFEAKLEEHQKNLTRAAVELSKDWRTDRYLRRLEAMLIVMDAETMLLLSGTGDVIEPDESVIAIGSGGSYALAAARALLRHTDLDAASVARQAMVIASEICVYTNAEITVEELKP
jgi:ATP-dependent HslUV protease subunit HslV